MEKQTYQDAARTALEVQDACNLSGVAHAFSRAVNAIWDEAHRTGKGTDWVNSHPICTLFISKLTDLNGREADFFKTYDAVKNITEGV
jgi:hypothetical protein